MNPSQLFRPQFFSALLILCAAFSPLFLAPQASGAVILWDTSPVDIDTQNASQVSTDGTLFAAVDANSGFLTGLTYTVNGVDFTTNVGNLNIQGNGAGNFGTAPGTPTTYSSIVNAIAYLVDTSSSLAPIQVSGLTSGQTYQVQLFTGYSNNTVPTTRYSDVAPTGPGYTHALNESPTVTVGYNTGNPLTTIFPQYILGTFVADPSGSESIYYYGDSGYGVIAALQLRAVPEPTTIGLLSFGGLALVLRHRFRQRKLAA